MLVTFALLVQFASFLADVERGEAGGDVAGRSADPHDRRPPAPAASRCSSTSRSISASFTIAYMLRVERDRDAVRRHVFDGRRCRCVLVARYLAFILLGLYRGVWRYAGARDAAAIVVGGRRLGGGRVRLVVGTTPLGDFPRAVFVIDALLCTVLDRCVALRRAGARSASPRRVGPRASAGARSIVGAGRSGPQPAARAARDARRARRRIRRRRPQPPPPPDARRPGLRRDRLEIERMLAATRPDIVLVTIPDAPPRAARCDRPSLRRRRRSLPFRPPRDRPRPARRARRRAGVMRRSLPGTPRSPLSAAIPLAERLPLALRALRLADTRARHAVAVHRRA